MHKEESSGAVTSWSEDDFWQGEGTLPVMSHKQWPIPLSYLGFSLPSASFPVSSSPGDAGICSHSPLPRESENRCFRDMLSC